jgi:hypothetical protein
MSEAFSLDAQSIEKLAEMWRAHLDRYGGRPPIPDHHSHILTTSGGKCREIRFTVKTTFTTGDSTITGTYVSGFDGEDPVAVDADIEVENDGNVFYAAAGAYGFARYDPETDTYHAYQFSCPPPVT